METGDRRDVYLFSRSRTWGTSRLSPYSGKFLLRGEYILGTPMGLRAYYSCYENG